MEGDIATSFMTRGSTADANTNVLGAAVARKSATVDEQLKYVMSETYRMLEAVSLAKQVLNERRGIESKSESFKRADLQEQRLRNASREQEKLRQLLLKNKDMVNFAYKSVYREREALVPAAASAIKSEDVKDYVRQIDNSPLVLYVTLDSETAAFRQTIGATAFQQLFSESLIPRDEVTDLSSEELSSEVEEERVVEMPSADANEALLRRGARV